MYFVFIRREAPDIFFLKEKYFRLNFVSLKFFLHGTFEMFFFFVFTNNFDIWNNTILRGMKLSSVPILQLDAEKTLCELKLNWTELAGERERKSERRKKN